MPRSFTSTFNAEKNSAENKPVHLYTFFDYDGASNNLYFTDSRENVTFDGQAYTAFPIRYDVIGEGTNGRIDKTKLTLGNVSRLIESYLQNYDLRGKKISIKTIFRDTLANPADYREDIYYVDRYSSDQQNVSFVTASKFDVLYYIIPQQQYRRTICRYKDFKGTRCGYAGAETECNRTLQRCEELGNQTRFGGQDGIPARGRVIII